MINLIKNELKKIFSKKSIYILAIITFAFIILNNVLYKFVIEGDLLDIDGMIYTGMSEEELTKLDLGNTEEFSVYVDIKTNKEIYELKQKYPKNSWQERVIDEKAHTVLYELNSLKYKPTLSETEQAMLNKAEEQYSSLMNDLNNSDWKTIVNKEITSIDLKIANLELQSDNMAKQEIKMLENQKETLQMRLDKDIPYGTDYLNIAIDGYVDCVRIIDELKNKEMTYQEKISYNNALELKAKSEYILNTKLDIQNNTNSRSVLANVFSEYGLFIIILVIIIAGTIVSEEFNKGTIKLLLIKPYSRIKILAAKYITVVIIILLTLIFTAIVQVLIGGIIFGFGNLSIPVVEYNFNTNTLMEFNIFAYVGIKALILLPHFLLIGLIAFTLSTIFTNSALAITMTLLTYMTSGIVLTITSLYKKAEFLKYWLTMNWNLDEYLFGRLSQLEFLNFRFSAIMCAIYFIALLAISLIVFKKKNIKNI